MFTKEELLIIELGILTLKGSVDDTLKRDSGFYSSPVGIQYKEIMINYLIKYDEIQLKLSKELNKQ